MFKVQLELVLGSGRLIFYITASNILDCNHTTQSQVLKFELSFAKFIGSSKLSSNSYREFKAQLELIKFELGLDKNSKSLSTAQLDLFH